ncbi:hypothetical protein D3C81_1999210 [compost metagenome]
MKTSLTLRLKLSVAVTLMFRLPTAVLPGVPLKVWLAALKLSQFGSGLPSARLAL